MRVSGCCVQASVREQVRRAPSPPLRVQSTTDRRPGGGRASAAPLPQLALRPLRCCAGAPTAGASTRRRCTRRGELAGGGGSPRGGCQPPSAALFLRRRACVPNMELRHSVPASRAAWCQGQRSARKMGRARWWWGWRGHGRGRWAADLLRRVAADPGSALPVFPTGASVIGRKFG